MANRISFGLRLLIESFPKRLGQTRPRACVLALFALSILLGTALRFAWTDDVEYKGDERQMFAWSQSIGRTQPWPALGMFSGAGVPNPGMSVWVFVVLARVFGATSPPALSEAVIFLNSAALFLLALIALTRIDEDSREGWLWAIALASVNPVAIQLQRKIWAQSVLPFFCALFLLAWFERRRALGALCWGLIGACLGQIHLSGFFFAGGFAVWTVATARESARWKWWVGGSALGVIPMIPWLEFVLPRWRDLAPPISWWEALQLPFWQFWLLEPFGFSIRYSLGPGNFSQFIRMPFAFGHPTYLLGAAHAVSFAIGGVVLLWALFARFFRGRLPAGAGDARVAQDSASWGFGGLMTLARVNVRRHYLITAFPLQYVFFTSRALRFPRHPRALLAIMWLAELGISYGFLYYIHTHGGGIGGDYGISFGAQNKILIWHP